MIPLLLLAAAAAAGPQPGAVKTFKDWTVGCDNARACHATSLLPAVGEWEDAFAMRVERGGEPGARPDIGLIDDRGEGKARAAVLVADGRRLAARLVAGKSDQTIDPAGVDAVVAALRSAARLEVQDSEGSKLGTISVAGASAALLYIDDMQKRVGTVTALARPGSKSASAVPAPPPLPRVRSAAAPAARPIKVDDARIVALRKQAQCIPDDKEFPGYDVEQEPLDPGHTLILLGCGAGAYNYSSVPYIATRGANGIDIRLAVFDVKASWEGDGPPMLVNAGWANEEGLLTTFAKGRGIGDCGVGSDYAWDGTRFRLVHQIEMRECRGSMDYITTWRAMVVKR